LSSPRYGGPRVRIPLPPARSLLRTAIEAISASKRRSRSFRRDAIRNAASLTRLRCGGSGDHGDFDARPISCEPDSLDQVVLGKSAIALLSETRRVADQQVISACGYGARRPGVGTGPPVLTEPGVIHPCPRTAGMRKEAAFSASHSPGSR
jgi:hypothetical protein